MKEGGKEGGKEGRKECGKEVECDRRRSCLTVSSCPIRRLLVE
jgi:hypothetical protein